MLANDNVTPRMPASAGERLYQVMSRSEGDRVSVIRYSLNHISILCCALIILTFSFACAAAEGRRMGAVAMMLAAGRAPRRREIS
ncbi:MAG: hypothetical protein WKF84_08725 [Pyrinomonadaceae bacterium]